MNENIKVITICGSMRFTEEMMKIAGELELKQGYAVIQCAYFLETDGSVGELLDKIHLKKIDISDAIYVVNIDGYIGESTRNKIKYATELGKEIIYHEPTKKNVLNHCNIQCGLI